MFNVGPLELMVLAIVGLIVLGPDKLPGLARDAANMLRTLRDMARGARQQLRDELGPEFADVDLRTLNPRHMVAQAVFGDDDPADYHPRNAMRRAVFGDGDGEGDFRDDLRSADPRNLMRDDPPSTNGSAPRVDTTKKSPPRSAPPKPPTARPRPRPAPYDDDAT